MHLKKYGMKLLVGFKWLRIGPDIGFFSVNSIMSLLVLKSRNILTKPDKYKVFKKNRVL
jgi:hypothetical protein